MCIEQTAQSMESPNWRSYHLGSQGRLLVPYLWEMKTLGESQNKKHFLRHSSLSIPLVLTYSCVSSLDKDHWWREFGIILLQDHHLCNNHTGWNLALAARPIHTCLAMMCWSWLKIQSLAAYLVCIAHRCGQAPFYRRVLDVPSAVHDKGQVRILEIPTTEVSQRHGDSGQIPVMDRAIMLPDGLISPFHAKQHILDQELLMAKRMHVCTGKSLCHVVHPLHSRANQTTCHQVGCIDGATSVAVTRAYQGCATT